jgi:4-hydroxy-3-polyprenylbenzoate decarboxylase
MGIDATRKWASEGYSGRWPDEIRMDDATKQRVSEMWNRLGIAESWRK